MPIASFNPAPVRPATPEYDQHRFYAREVAGHTIPALDRNGDAVLGRDEYKGSQFNRADFNGDGGITLTELEEAVMATTTPDIASAMHTNAYNATWKLGANFDHFRFMGKASVGFGALIGGIGAWITGVTPWLALPLLPAVAFIAAGVYIHQTQSPKPDRLRERLMGYLDETLQGRAPAYDDYENLATPFGSKVEQTIGAIGAVIYAPFKAIVEFILLLRFVIGPWSQG